MQSLSSLVWCCYIEEWARVASGPGSVYCSHLSLKVLQLSDASAQKVLALLVRVYVLSSSQQQIFAGGCNIWNRLKQYSFPTTTRQTYGMWFNWYLTIVFWLSLRAFKCWTISWFSGRSTRCRISEQKARAGNYWIWSKLFHCFTPAISWWNAS